MRSGALALSLLASPTNCLVLRALADGHKAQTELRRAAGSPAQSTLRTQLRRLCESGVIERRRKNRFPGVVEHELTGAGRELLTLIETMDRWLRSAPEGPLSLGDSGAKAAIKALVEGWSTAMLRLMAARPLTLTELDGIITSLNYPSLERRLTAMKLAGQIEQAPSNGRGTPYRVTEWTRRAVAPLVAAARWERRHVPETTASISKLDVEGTFLLALPLLRLSPTLGGTCRLAVDLADDQKHRLAGVLVEVEEGRTVSCTTRLEGHPEAWTYGSAAAWLAALLERETDRLEIGGDNRFARSLLEGLHDSLFGLGTGRTTL
jgi:DNA-binding HxlR family transcriptional regulator